MNADSCGAMCGMVVVLAMMFFLANDLKEANRRLHREAVERGYAEWYAEKPGEQATSWRWKELSK